MLIDKLTSVLPLPDPREHNFNWDTIEKTYDIIFPEDYKLLLNLYGHGSIDNFFWILTPFCEDANINVFSQLETMKNAYGAMRDYLQTEFDYGYHPQSGGLFPWCLTENGDELYWSKHKGTLKIVVFEARYAKKHEYEMGIIEFLYKLLSRDIICSAFPESLWRTKHYFTPS